MMQDAKYRIVVDTNLWISFLIGKRLSEMLGLLVERKVTLVFSSALLREVLEVASRPKFNRYFAPNAVVLLEHFLRKYAEFYELEQIHKRCRDPKDDYLLELSLVSDADFLISGDSDLLDLGTVGNTVITTFAMFKSQFCL